MREVVITFTISMRELRLATIHIVEEVLIHRTMSQKETDQNKYKYCHWRGVNSFIELAWVSIGYLPRPFFVRKLVWF